MAENNKTPKQNIAWFLMTALSLRAALKGTNTRLLKGNCMLDPRSSGQIGR
jgi:hypothetical protein